LALDLEQGLVRNLTRRTEIPFQPLPALMKKIVQAGGVIPFLESDEGRALLSPL
jgi:hypothetical protein